MEVSPLPLMGSLCDSFESPCRRKITSSKAYGHARAASIATQTSDTTVAINEHTLAAGEFARAADQTGSQEALRTLKLLESHHQRPQSFSNFHQRENPVITTTIADADIVSEIEKNVSTSAAVSELRNPKNETSNLALPDERRRLHQIYMFRDPCLSAS